MSETPVAKVHWLLVLVDGWRMEHLAAEEEEEVDGTPGCCRRPGFSHNPAPRRGERGEGKGE